MGIHSKVISVKLFCREWVKNVLFLYFHLFFANKD